MQNYVLLITTSHTRPTHFISTNHIDFFLVSKPFNVSQQVGIFSKRYYCPSLRDILLMQNIQNIKLVESLSPLLFSTQNHMTHPFYSFAYSPFTLQFMIDMLDGFRLQSNVMKSPIYKLVLHSNVMKLNFLVKTTHKYGQYQHDHIQGGGGGMSINFVQLSIHSQKKGIN